MKSKITTYVALAIFLLSMIGTSTVSADSYTLNFTICYQPYQWTNHGNMHDDDPDTYASTTDDTDSERLGFSVELDDLGDITKVEIQARGYWSGAQHNITLQPFFGRYPGAPGDEHEFVLTNTASYSGWIDITTDTNAHSFWTFDDVEELTCLISVGEGSSGFTVYCSIVQVRVTYTPD